MCLLPTRITGNLPANFFIDVGTYPRWSRPSIVTTLRLIYSHSVIHVVRRMVLLQEIWAICDKTSVLSGNGLSSFPRNILFVDDPVDILPIFSTKLLLAILDRSIGTVAGSR